MLIVVSPAKKLNMLQQEDIKVTDPFFLKNAYELASIASNLKINGLQKLMNLSENLAQLNEKRFVNFGKQEKKPAAFAFAGDTYQGLDVKTLNKSELEWAQSHLRILSGLYGLLRPYDAIEPYRLEMGCKLKNKHGSSLYEYWGKQLSVALNIQAKITESKFLINCASQEYFSAVNASDLSLQVITPVFMDRKEGKDKIISFFAKRARGAMARYIVQQRMVDIEKLKSFNDGGYVFQPEKSDKQKMIFLRNNQE